MIGVVLIKVTKTQKISSRSTEILKKIYFFIIFSSLINEDTKCTQSYSANSAISGIYDIRLFSKFKFYIKTNLSKGVLALITKVHKDKTETWIVKC